MKESRTQKELGAATPIEAVKYEGDTESSRESTSQFAADHGNAPAGPAELLGIIWRGRFVMALTTIAALAIGTAYIFVREPTYTSVAHLVFSPVVGGTAGGDLVSVGGADPLTVSGRDIYSELYQSDRIGERVANELALFDDPEFNKFIEGSRDNGLLGSLKSAGRWLMGDDQDISEEQIRRSTINLLFSKVQFTPATPEGDVVLISATSQDSEKSAVIANAMAANIVEQRRESRIEIAESSMERLTQHVETLRIQSEADQKDYQDFLIDFESNGDTNLAALSIRAGRIQARLETAMADLRSMEQSASGGSTESTPDSQKRLVEALQSNFDAAQARIEEVSAASRRLRQLQLAADASSATYEAALRRVRANMAISLMQDPGVRIEVRAVPPIGPDGLGETQLLGLIAVLGLFTGLSFIVLREVLRERPIHVSEIEQLVSPHETIAIPRLGGWFSFLRKEDDAQTVGQHGSDDYSEAIRRIRTSVLDQKTLVPQVVGMFSVGKTDPHQAQHMTALAQSFATIGKRVLLIDADLRGRTLSQSLGLSDAKRGLCSAITKGSAIEDVTREKEEVGFGFVPTGSCTISPGDLLSSPEFAHLMRQAKSNYDLVLVSGPAIDEYTDAQLVIRETNCRILLSRLRVGTFNQNLVSLQKLLSGSSSRVIVAISDVDRKALARAGSHPVVPQWE